MYVYMIKGGLTLPTVHQANIIFPNHLLIINNSCTLLLDSSIEWKRKRDGSDDFFLSFSGGEGTRFSLMMILKTSS